MLERNKIEQDRKIWNKGEGKFTFGNGKTMTFCILDGQQNQDEKISKNNNLEVVKCNLEGKDCRLLGNTELKAENISN